jgi:uncharacterized protein YbcC (UPF0753/DUF2309 family)
VATGADPTHPGDDLAAWLAHAAHVLPNQGPIGVFVHHNPLHGFQHLNFHDAAAQVAPLRGARVYLDEERFRSELAAGRIEHRDLEEALPATPDAPLPLGLTVRGIRLLLLERGLQVADPQGLRYQLAVGTVRPDPARWAAAERRLAARPAVAPPAPAPRRHRDVLVLLGASDPDVVVHAELQRLSASFLDEGQALAHLPGREQGFLSAVVQSWLAAGSWPRGASGLASDLARTSTLGAEAIVAECLDALGVSPELRADFVEATLLALPGWAGMFGRLERNPEEQHAPAPARLAEFLAVRLLLERQVVAGACREVGAPLDWARLRTAPVPAEPADPIVAVALLDGLAAAAGADAAAVERLSDPELDALFTAVDGFPVLARQRVFQEAYEGWYRRRILAGLEAQRRSRPPPRVARPLAAFVFCIDEREESIRRALEEQDAGFDTYGAAGFFGVAIDYQGLDDVRPAAYCPAVVVPGHEVREEPVFTQRTLLQTRQRLRSVWQRWLRSLSGGTRALLGGAAQSILLGPALGARTAGQVLAPRRVTAASRILWNTLIPAPATRLLSLRTDPDQRTRSGKLEGFSTEEKVERVGNLLVNLGLVRAVPPVVVVLGHGSTSLNNPHESAHDCGACGGRQGGANARLFAEMANRPEVRAGLRLRGIEVPADTWFVGALHDTADDSIRYYDLDRLPQTHTAAFDRCHAALELARRESARERARRFDDAPLGLDPEQALAHVEERAASLAQPRPEYGHCTNAVAVVGRRSLTRGLFLDRRAFLVTYDPTLDAEHRVLERILAAVGPVGAGINLEYWFSSVDNEAWGCGTKLPHNVTGLVGVMNGHASDLRTGLPLQMVELHEPMRLLLIVEATPEALGVVVGRQPEVRDLVVNEWVQVVSVDPETGAMAVFRGGAFHPWIPDEAALPTVARSVDWYGAHRAHLGPALVEAGRG